MSYRYPHQDDSDENGFGESLQPSRSQARDSHASESSDDDVFEGGDAAKGPALVPLRFDKNPHTKVAQA